MYQKGSLSSQSFNDAFLGYMAKINAAVKVLSTNKALNIGRKAQNIPSILSKVASYP